MNTIAGGSDLLSYYNEAYGSSNTGSANKLQNTLSNADYSQASEEELYDVCKQFESYFVEQVIKQMEKMIPESDEDSTASKYMDYFGDTLYQELAEDVTESNNGEGIGIAKTLYEQMKRTGIIYEFIKRLCGKNCIQKQR